MTFRPTLIVIWFLSLLRMFGTTFLQPEFTAMREQYMRAGEGFVVCYSVIARRSFDEALEYKKLIDRVRSADTTPIVLVANKCDLEHLRKVRGAWDIHWVFVHGMATVWRHWLAGACVCAWEFGRGRTSIGVHRWTFPHYKSKKHIYIGQTRHDLYSWLVFSYIWMRLK